MPVIFLSSVVHLPIQVMEMLTIVLVKLAVFVVLLAWALLPMVLMPARCTSMATMPPRLPMRTAARSSVNSRNL